MSQFSRRTVLALGMLGPQALVAGCGGGGSDSATSEGPTSGTAPPAASPAPVPAPAPAPVPAPEPPPPPPPPAPPPVVMWDVGPGLAVFADGASAFDLNRTLPSNARRGGQFSVSPAGAALPDGVVLSPDGLISAGVATLVDSYANIVFEYVEP